MKMAELSRRAGVSVASIKYYRREGVLQPGDSTASNQAEYDETHVRRLRLIRSLVDIGGLSMAAVKRTLAAVDDPAVELHDAFGAVMHGLDDLPESSGVVDARDEVRVWLHERGWTVEEDAPAPAQLAELVATLRTFGFSAPMSEFDAAADVAERNAEFEVACARNRPDRTSAVETMLIGTVVYERVFAQIRRLALESASRRLADPS